MIKKADRMFDATKIFSYEARIKLKIKVSLQKLQYFIYGKKLRRHLACVCKDTGRLTFSEILTLRGTDHFLCRGTGVL